MILYWLFRYIKILFDLVDVIILVARSMTFVWFFDSRFSGQDTMLCAEVVEFYFKLYGRKNPVLTMSAAVTAAASAATAVSNYENKQGMLTFLLSLFDQNSKKIFSQHLMLSFTERNELERVLSRSLSNSLLSVPGILIFCVRTTALILPLI